MNDQPGIVPNPIAALSANSTDESPDEFYVGWEDRAPAGPARWAGRTATLLLLLTSVLGVGLAFTQRTIGVSVFEWGNLKEFTGFFRARPYPHLLVPRPGLAPAESSFSTYYLVQPFKFGIMPDIADPLDGQWVQLRGTLIYRDNQTMIEVARHSLRLADATAAAAQSTPPMPAPSRLGRQTLVGEIVDSKCFLGVMNPGALTPHRACAIRCISGGIPPILLVRQPKAPPLCLLVVSSDGKPINQSILDLVAEPVAITGEVERQGTLLVLKADPATYRRVSGRYP